MAFNFGLVGAAGFVAPRHMKAIADTGNVLIAALDPHDSVGIIDTYFPDAAFFTEVERFDRFLEKRRHLGEGVQYLSICSPNYLHDAHVRLALRVGADAICEKPLVLSPWNLDQLAALEQEYGHRVYSVLQLRLLPQLRALKQRLGSGRASVELTYITPRGRWHEVSWKGVPEKSGGIALNIGVHFFDALIWLYGLPQASRVFMSRPDKMSGVFELERARVSWFLSVDAADLPQGKTAYRSLVSDGHEVEFSDGFPDLHTDVYRDILGGGGFSIEDVRPSIQLAHDIRMATPVTPDGDAHRALRQEPAK
ncbi:MAG: Gfo/Idh/MocA family oxidoreductase [Kofleriaceae bacterium]